MHDEDTEDEVSKFTDVPVEELVKAGISFTIKKDYESRLANIQKYSPDNQDAIDELKNKIAEITTGQLKNLNIPKNPKLTNLFKCRRNFFEDLQKGLNDGSLKIEYLNGIRVHDSLEFLEKDQERKFFDQETSERVVKTLSAVYQSFKELGFDVKTSTVTHKESSLNYFAIRFPKSYMGNKKIMTMSNEDIELALDCMNKEDYKTPSTDVSDFKIERIGSSRMMLSKDLTLKALDKMSLQAKGESAEEWAEERVSKTKKQHLLHLGKGWVEKASIENKEKGQGKAKNDIVPSR